MMQLMRPSAKITLVAEMIPALFATLINGAFFTSTKKLFVQTFTLKPFTLKAKEKRTIGKETLKAGAGFYPCG